VSKPVLGLLLLGLGLGLAVWLLIRGVPEEVAAPSRPPNLSRFDAAFDRNLTELAAVPAFRAQLAGLPRKELRQAIQSLAAKGMRRLPDERLAVRTRIVGRMLEGLDLETCSAMATGRQNEAVHDAAVIVLDPESLEEWVALSFEAARAELEKRPATRPSPQELQLALSVLFKRVPEADSERLRQALAGLSEKPPAEACWAARTTYAAAAELPAPVARVLERELAGP
jgi:hypothetical protein